MAAVQVRNIGEEILRAQAALGMSSRQLARLAGVATSTVRRVHNGDGGVQAYTICAIASALGLKVTLRAWEQRSPTLRDTGQLRVAELIRSIAHESLRPALEVRAGDHGRSADMLLFGPEEILHVEIERMLLDFQAQYRSALRKREYLDGLHARPVRLVLAVEDTERNRTAAAPHLPLIRSALPAGSRAVLNAVRNGRPLGTDGILWVRPRSLGRPS